MPESNLSSRVERLEHATKQLRCDLTDIEAHMYGNGNGKAGLLLDVDRMKQRDIYLSKVGLLAGSVIAAIISGLIQLGLALIK